MANAPIKMEVLPRLPLPSNANQQSNVNKYREAYNPYMPTTPNLNPVWNTGVPAPVPAAVMQPTPVATITQSAVPAPTVEQNIADKNKTSLQIGANIGNQQAEASRKADMTKTLMGGDMGKFMANLLRMFAQPEFQQAGFAGQGFGPTVLGATRALRAMETQDIEAAKLQAAEQERAAKLQATQASEANKAAVDQMRLAMEKERLGLARQAESRQETRDRVQRGKLTKTQLEGLKMLIESDPQIKALMETLDGTGLGRLLGFSPSTENVTGYITSRVVELQAADPSISVRDAAIQAASELANKATTASDGSTNVKPAAGGADTSSWAKVEG